MQNTAGPVERSTHRWNHNEVSDQSQVKCDVKWGLCCSCDKDSNGHVNYHHFVMFLNWVEHPFDGAAVKVGNDWCKGTTSFAVTMQATPRWKGSWTGFGDNRETVTMINYNALLADLSSQL